MGRIAASSPDRRRSPLRRQVNEAFCAPDGRISISKVLAVFAQIAVLFHMGRSFELLIDRPEALLIVLSFLIAPDFLKKLISMKYGAAQQK